MKEKLKHIYEHHYKKLMLIPFLLVVLALVQIGTQYALTGDFIHRGVSLNGGSTITFSSPSSISGLELEQFLREKFPKGDLSVRTLGAVGQGTAFAIDSDAQEKEEVTSLLQAIQEKVPLQKEAYSVEVFGSSLSETFFKQLVLALLISFGLMGIVVMLYFRLLIPSLAVIAAAFSDIVVTLAIFNLTGMKLTTAGIAAFLMLIGYSVDTDVVLTTRVLKRHEGSVMENIYSSIKTGLTMTVTTLAAIIVALIFVRSEVVQQIMIILAIGLVMDTFMTWIQNVGILRLYLERKKS
ncbi:MAG: protein translocase subunit SecF [Nanoarchaeota archaeon]